MLNVNICGKIMIINVKLFVEISSIRVKREAINLVI